MAKVTREWQNTTGWWCQKKPTKNVRE